MEGGSVHDIIMQRSKRLSLRDILKIAIDVAEGLAFMNSYAITYRDLNARRILLDRQGNACLGDMGIVTPCNNAGEVTEYETSGYRWLAPEVSFLGLIYLKFTSLEVLSLEISCLLQHYLFISTHRHYLELFVRRLPPDFCSMLGVRIGINLTKLC